MTVLEQGVRELLEEFIDVPSDAFAPLALASLTLVEVVQELEERFGVAIKALDVVPENFRTISSIVAFVNKRKP